MANPPEGSYPKGYEPSQYTGRFSVQGVDFASQYQNKPQLQWPPPPEKPIKGRHFTGIITDDLIDDPPKDPRYSPEAHGALAETRLMYQKWVDHNKSKKEAKQMDEEETRGKDYEHHGLYEVITTYGADRNNVEVETTRVVAEDSKRALMMVRDDIDDDWDMDYVSQHVDQICVVRVKKKPRNILAPK